MSSAVAELESFLPRFGLTQFRPGQRDVIEAVLAGQDCLCVMPTGGGKSLCYQLPAVIGEGQTLVVSPLIALMKDQVDNLIDQGIRATFINSTLNLAEQNERLDRMAAGEYELVYVVPERFRSPRFLDALKQTRLKLLAIDEAHCISEWGHDFRPDYARLGQFRVKIGDPPTIALTATATDAVRKAIVELLGLKQPHIVITGFARPNLFYEVQSASTQFDKEEALCRFLKETPGTGIVYASSRKRCEDVAEMITERTKRKALPYHAGMLAEDRTSIQNMFMSGAAEIIVATTAFGMGIDKADVRFVVHYNLPGSIEGYYQEAGRAGRDGLPARCLFLYSAGDRYIHEFFIESAYPAREVVEEVYDFLLNQEVDPLEMAQDEVKEALDLDISAEGVRACEVLLEKAGVIERLEPCQNMAAVRISSDLPSLVDYLPKSAKNVRKVLRAAEKIVGNRRHELIYFQPRELAALTELEPEQISRALKELNELEPFEYVPPFRGRAIHVRRRDVAFDDLDIDFETLEERKAAEYERLERVVTFARSRHCRQLDILKYFGDPAAQPCGHCDNCGSRPQSPATATESKKPLHPAIIESARKALAGVARCQDRFAGGGFGKGSIAKMLCGSKSADMTRWGLTRLSTYGILRPLKQDEVNQLLDGLIGCGCLEQVEIERFRPVVRLTDFGAEVMKNRQALPQQLALTKELRKRLAAMPVAAPAQEVTDEKPSPADRPSPVEVAPPLPTATEPENVPLADPASAPEITASTDTPPDYYWTWRVLAAGFKPEECALVRGMEVDQVWEHAILALEADYQVDVLWFTPRDLVLALDRLVDPEDPAPVRELLKHLPTGTSAEHVRWYLKCRATHR